MNALSSVLHLGFIVSGSTMFHYPAKINISRNECVNCSSYSGDCTVQTTGWSPFKMSRTDHNLVTLLDADTDGDPNLARCVLDGYHVTDGVETFICFWAPYMGCQGVANINLINKHHIHHIVCIRCAQYCGCPISLNNSDYKASGRTRLMFLGLIGLISFMVWLQFKQ